MKTIRMCQYYDMETKVTMSSGRSGFIFHVTRCRQFANLDMSVAEPETYSADSWHELSPDILSDPGFVECVLEDFLSDIGVEGHFFPSMISDISSAMSMTDSPCFTVDVMLYLFSFEEQCPPLDGEHPSPAIKESGPCSICLEDAYGDREVIKLPCLHEFHIECIIRWLCSGNATCPLCRRKVDMRTS